MRDAAWKDFPLAPDLVLLNHASYGVPTRRVLAAAEAVRAEIESDPVRLLGAELTGRLRARTRELAAELGLDPSLTTLCANATSGAAAIIDSVELPAGATVAVLETEYSSILRAWERRCGRSGATLVRVPVRLPFTSAGDLVGALDAAVRGDVAYVQMSLVSSSSAVWFPVAEVAAWTRARGGSLVLDVAHGPGHVPVDPGGWGVAAMFGTVHKWLPTLRPVGLLWLSETLAPTVRPAEVSLTWDSDDLVERFSWPGTFDPVPRLTLDVALEQWRQWKADGSLEEARNLAEAATESLAAAGALPTTVLEHAPPRLRAFVLEGAEVPRIKDLLKRAGVRAWVGLGADGECILRVSLHVYNDMADVETVVSQIRGVLRR